MPGLHLTDLGDDLLAEIAGHLDLADRKALSQVSTHLRHASQLPSWWSAEMSVRVPVAQALESFTAWLQAHTLGTTRLIMRVESEQLISREGGELPHVGGRAPGRARQRAGCRVVALNDELRPVCIADVSHLSPAKVDIKELPDAS